VARQGGEGGVPEELRLYPARSQSGKKQRGHGTPN